MDAKLMLSIMVLLFTFMVFVTNRDVLAVGVALIGAVLMTGVSVASASYVIEYVGGSGVHEQDTTHMIEENSKTSAVVEIEDYEIIKPVSLGKKSDKFIRTASMEENKYLSDIFLGELEEHGKVTDNLTNDIEDFFYDIEGVGRIKIDGSKGSMPNARVQMNIKTYDDENDELMKVFTINGTAK